MHEQARFSRTTEGNGAVLRVSGDLDLSNKDQFECALAEGLATARVSFVVDLQEITYLDSTGLVCLIQACKHAEDEGKTFSLVINGNGHLKKLFDVTGVSTVCNVKHASPDLPEISRTFADSASTADVGT